MERFGLQGNVAIVTGAGAGIGRAIALALSDSGASVMVADISSEGAETVAEEIRVAGGIATPIQTDVTRSHDVAELVKSTQDVYGRIDILVNNAGGGPAGAVTTELSVEDWHATLDLTLTSAFLCAQRVGPHMFEQHYGRIVNIASVYGLVGHDTSLYDPRSDGSPNEGLAYAAAKGGLISLTRTLATYWAPHAITVNAVAPGMVKTERLGKKISSATWDRLSERTPLRRPATPDDIASAVVYLATPAAAFVTGQVLVVDGGWTVW